MTRAIVTVAACATLLWTGAVLAAPTTQQNCDKARIKAWAKYVSCVDGIVAKIYGGAAWGNVSDTAFAKCRHKYFQKWAALQGTSYSGSTCAVGLTNRFTDNGDGTVTDNLTTLVWEQKTDDGNVHDKDNTYQWSAGCDELKCKEDGPVFTSFLTDATTGLNVTGFAGAYGWRLPTLAELQTTFMDFECKGHYGDATCQCPANPCIDEGTFGPMVLGIYWSSETVPTPTGYVPLRFVWAVHPTDAAVVEYDKLNSDYVRAVRGGL